MSNKNKKDKVQGNVAAEPIAETVGIAEPIAVATENVAETEPVAASEPIAPAAKRRGRQAGQVMTFRAYKVDSLGALHPIGNSGTREAVEAGLPTLNLGEATIAIMPVPKLLQLRAPKRQVSALILSPVAPAAPTAS